MISIIVAIDDKRGIGKSTNAANQGLLWHISEDFKRFKRLTTGHPIIMGRKTHEMIGRVLPNRTNVIITRDKNYKVDGATVVHTLEQALGITKKSQGSEEIFVIGGEQVFAQALPIADKIYLTKVKGDFGADVFFPSFEKEFTRKTFEEYHPENDPPFTWIDLAKKQNV